MQQNLDEDRIVVGQRIRRRVVIVTSSDQLDIGSRAEESLVISGLDVLVASVVAIQLTDALLVGRLCQAIDDDPEDLLETIEVTCGIDGDNE